jgi:hypothetical protein
MPRRKIKDCFTGMILQGRVDPGLDPKPLALVGIGLGR